MKRTAAVIVVSAFFVVLWDAVDDPNELLFQEARCVPPGAVVCRIGNPQPLGVFDQSVARETVSQGQMIVLTLGGQVRSPVLANADKAKAG